MSDIKLLIENKDWSQLVEKITWSGDSKQAARKLQFSIASKDFDRFLPKASIAEGDMAVMQLDGVNLFGGKILEVEKSSSGNTITYTALDFMYYLLQNQISLIVDCTAEECAAKVCDKLGITLDGASATGVKVYMPAIGKSGYDIIMAAYTKAAAKTGKIYCCRMENINGVQVIEKGELCGVILDGEYNLTEAKYKVSAQNMVNRVIVVDDSGNELQRLESTGEQAKFGTMQRIYKKSGDEDAGAAAKALLKGLEESGSVRATPADVRAQSGWAVVVKDKVSGLAGKFYIDSDSHTWEDGKSEMQLTLAFANVMDEKEAE